MNGFPLFFSCLECNVQVQGPTSGLRIVSGVLVVECSTVRCSAYPCGWRGAALWRFGAKRWWAESRVTRSTRWQEYLFSSASPGLVIWLGITWEPRETRTSRLARGKSLGNCTNHCGEVPTDCGRGDVFVWIFWGAMGECKCAQCIVVHCCFQWWTLRVLYSFSKGLKIIWTKK